MIAGPGAEVEEIVHPSPTLEGASEYEYVTIKNPLEVGFAIKVAQSVPVNMPFEIHKDNVTSTVTNTEQDVRTVYGVSLKNPDFKSRKHVTNTTIIPAGGTINLKGDIAQVAVRQLTNEIMQRRNLNKFIADPTQRNIIEKEIIVARGSVQDLMDNNIKSVREQTDEAIAKSNPKVEETNGEAFPEVRRGRPSKDKQSV